jgi:hypothetical protein
LDYFWCIIYQYIYIYKKIGKGKREKEKGKGFSVSWAGGGGGFRPCASAGTRRRGRAGPNDPRGGETACTDAVSAGPCARERRRVDGVGRSDGGGGEPAGFGKNQRPTRFHGGSPPWFWFWLVGEVA